MIRRLLPAVSLVAVVLIVSVAANWTFLQRYSTFLWHGYDAHTVPVDWFSPKVIVRGGSGSALPLARPGARAMPDALLDELAEFAALNDSSALIVVRDDQVQLEQYWGNASRNTLFNPQSMSKTVLAMLVGIAIGEGHIRSVNDPVGDYLAEWADDPRGDITIEHLLQMSGGLAQLATDYRPVPWSRAVWQHFGTDFDSWALGLEQSDPPGAKFDYNNNENQLLGRLLEKATGSDYAEYLSTRLWQPLEQDDAYLYVDSPGGSAMKSCCIFSRPIDWAKLGLLLLDDGRYDGRQVLPPGWVDKMTTPAAANPTYGYQLWLNGPGLAVIGDETGIAPQTWWSSEPYLADDIYTFVGHGFQHVWVIPALDLVIVRGTRQWPSAPWDQSHIPNRVWEVLTDDGGSS